jgi:hypothetical protein
MRVSHHANLTGLAVDILGNARTRTTQESERTAAIFKLLSQSTDMTS